MSDEQQTLPETDDPFELLGVEPTVDERQLKRAYVRAIKRFRPNKHPEQFKRIRAAYESALESIQFRLIFGDDAESLEGSDEQAGALDPTDDVANSAPNMGSDAAAAVEQVAREDGPDAGYPSAPDQPEREQPARAPDDESEQLQAIEPLHQELTEAIEADDHQRMTAVLRSADLQRALLRDPGLEREVLRVLYLVAWEDLALAEEMQGLVDFVPDDYELVELHDMLSRACRLNPAWQQVRSSCTPELSKWLRHWPILDYDQLEAQLSAVRDEALAQSKAFLAIVDRLIDTDDSGLYHHFRESVERFVDPDEEEPLPFTSDVGGTLHQLDAIVSAEEKGDDDNAGCGYWLLWILVIGAVRKVGDLVNAGTWWYVFPALVVVYLLYRFFRTESANWDEVISNMRKLATAEMLRYRVGSGQLMDHLIANKRDFKEIGTFFENLRDDASLQLVGLLSLASREQD